MPRKPKCRFCEKMKDNYRIKAVLARKGIEKRYSLSILEYTIRDGRRRIDRDDNPISPGFATGYKILYCPMCGKPISEKEVMRNGE